MDRATPLSGGAGFVFEGTGPEGPVALKLLGQIDDQRFELLRSRLLRVSERPHPNVARPLELFRGPGLFTGSEVPSDEDCDLVYTVTSWAVGEPLRSAAPMPLPAVARMAVDLSLALAHLHQECGLVHRDLHPGNVVVDDAGGAMLIDLGAVRPADGSHTETIVGTLGFIAPECTHEPGDRRADAWGLGMLVVFALLGHPKGRVADTEFRKQLDGALKGASHHRRAVALLTAMVNDDPTLRPADIVAWANDLEIALQGRIRPALAQRWVGVAATGAGIAAVLALLLPPGDGDPGNPTTSSTGPAIVCSETDFARRDAALAAAAACSTGPPSAFGDATVHPVQTAAGRRMLVSSEFGTVLLTVAQMTSYRDIAGRTQPENAITYGGYPVSVENEGHQFVIELSGNGAIVGPRDDTQSFWMPKQVQRLWDERHRTEGELGFPMTNPFIADDGLRQDFERGTVLLPKDSPPFANVLPSVFRVLMDESPGSGLAGMQLTGRLLRQPTGTVWYVDNGLRRWVPDGQVYSCLGGDDAVVADQVKGSDIATLPLGPPMSC